VNLKGKSVIDVGCGTGRHWPRILAREPAKLVGYDVSDGMVQRLRQKYPEAATFILHGAALDQSPAQSCGAIVSTLVLAHIEHLEPALAEWDRVLEPGGDVLITDYHPDALAKGADRTFRHEGNVIAVKNYLHPLDSIRQAFVRVGWIPVDFREIRIDESLKHFYEKQDALSVYQRFYLTPIVCGWHLKKYAPAQR
jgi:ubiquinone/menaquinone biosynthesis C-methylase UbiE